MPKKLLCLLFALCAILCLCLFFGTTALAADCYTQTRLEYTEKGDNLAISVNGTEARAMITLAFYNEEKVVSIVPLLSANGADVNFIIDEGLTFDTVKVFSFDNTSTLLPLGEPEVLDVSEFYKISLNTLDIDYVDVEDDIITFKYWESENATRVTELEFDTPENVTLFYNNVEVGNLADSYNAKDYFFALTDCGFFCEVTLIRNHNSNLFNIIHITKYEFGVVIKADSENKYIKTNECFYDLSEDYGLISYQIYKDNQLITLDDLQVGDRLNVIVSDFDNEIAYEFYVTNDNIIIGTISMVRQDNAGNNIYTIDSTDYYAVHHSDWKPGTYGNFHITIDGRIYDVEPLESPAMPEEGTAFILDIIEETNGLETSYLVKMLTHNNCILEIPLAPVLNVSMKIDGVFKIDLPFKTIESSPWKQSNLFGENGTITLAAKNNTQLASPEQINIDELLIKYKTDGYVVTSITFVSSLDNNQIFSPFSNIYDKATCTLGNHLVTNKTIIFEIVPVYDSTYEYYFIDENKVQAHFMESLKSDASYNGYISSTNRNEVDLLIITNNMPSALSETPLTIVKNISQGINAKGNPATILNVWRGEGFVSYAESDKLNFNLDSLSTGDVVQVAVNTAGEVDDIALIYDIDYNYEYGVLETKTDGYNVHYAAGVVTDDNKGVRLESADGVWELGWAPIDGGTNVVFDVAKTYNPNIAFIGKSDTSHIVSTISKAGDIFDAYAYILVTKYNDDYEIEDVVAYKYNAKGMPVVDLVYTVYSGY